MKSRPIGPNQSILASQNNDRRDDARGSGSLLPHQMLGSLSLGTAPTNGQVIPIVVNGTTITITAKTGSVVNPNDVYSPGTAAGFTNNVVNFLRRPDLTNSNQVAASGANQTLLQYVGWAYPGSATTIIPFSLNKNVNGNADPLTSFNITGITVTSGSWTAQTMQLYIQDGVYYIGTTRIIFSGGTTPTFTAPVSHPRIDIVTADSSGTIAITQGTESSSPVAPAYPTGKVVLCEVYNVVGETGIYDNENQQSGQGYISNDVRSIVIQPYGSGIVDGAWFTDLAGIPSGAGVIPAINLPANSYNAAPFTAATAISKGNALILGGGVSGYLTGNNQVGTSTFAMNQSGSGDEVAQSFTTSARTTAIRAVLIKTVTSNGNSGFYGYTATIYAANGSNQPTGASLGSATATLAQNSTQTVTVTFSSPVAVSPSTTYCLVISSASTGSNGQSTTAYYNSSAGYASGSFSTTTNGGTSWTTSASESLWYEMWETFTAAGKVQPSDTTQTILSGDNYDLAYNFCGFALSSVSSGASVNVNLGPIDADQTGLTTGDEYYLNGSGGAIGTTAGAVSVKIGLSMSATQLLIKFDNYP